MAKMVALQRSLKIDSLYALGSQATKLQGFVWNFATFARVPFGGDPQYTKSIYMHYCLVLFCEVYCVIM